MAWIQSSLAHVLFKLRLNLRLENHDDCTIAKSAHGVFPFGIFAVSDQPIGQHNLPVQAGNQGIFRLCRESAAGRNHGRNDCRLYAGSPSGGNVAGDNQRETYQAVDAAQSRLEETTNFRPAPRRAAMPRPAESANDMDCRRIAAASDARRQSWRTAGIMVLADHDNGSLREWIESWGRAVTGGRRFSFARPRSFDSNGNTENTARPVLTAVCPYGGETGRASLYTCSNADIPVAALSAMVLRSIPADRGSCWIVCQPQRPRPVSQDQADEHFVSGLRVIRVGSAAGRAYVGMDNYDGAYGGNVGFEYEFYEKHDEKGRYLWIYAEEHGYVDRVAHLVQKFLRQFRPDETWSLTYSVTCSKPRVSDFGGGAVVVSATDIKWFNAWDFVEEQKHKSKLRIIVEISDGVAQDVYCSDPRAECVVVDWDCCELDDDSVEVDSGIASIAQHEVCPLDNLTGTDVEAALINVVTRFSSIRKNLL